MYEYSAMYSQFLAYILISLYYVCALYNVIIPFNFYYSISTLKTPKRHVFFT